MALIFGHGSSVAATVALIFAAPHFRSSPTLLTGWLLSIVVLNFFLFYFSWKSFAYEPGKSPAAPNSVHARGESLYVYLAMILSALFIFAPFYFSDDSIRHIFDGVYMLAGVDVYRIPPRDLGAIACLMPNHPHLPTIYLPFTQVQALVGAMFSERYGFLFVQHFISALLIAIVFHFTSGRERRLFAALVFSPFFLIAAASRHADIQGCLLVIACLTLLNYKGAGSGAGVGRATPRAPLGGLFLMAGFLAALLPGLKPEGVIWYGALSALVLLRENFSVRHWTSWFVVGAATLILQAIFALIYMFPTSESLEGFRSTAVFFSNWFTAYNPVIALRSGGGRSLHTIIGEVRGGVLVLCLVVLGATIIFAGHRARKNNPGPTFRGLLSRLVFPCLLVLLGGVILSRGAWNPWYFLWFLPALHVLGAHRTAFGLLLILPLFYLPVIQLRALGQWDFSTFTPFYFLTMAAALGWFLLTEMGPRPLIRRIWAPDKNHP